MVRAAELAQVPTAVRPAVRSNTNALPMDVPPEKQTAFSMELSGDKMPQSPKVLLNR